MTKQWEITVTASDNRIEVENESGLQEAAAMLREGRLVAFPTETVYGLGANATDSGAVAGIFEAKGRPSDNPLIVHISDTEQLAPLTTSYGALENELMQAFWPGPLTLVLPVREGAVSPLVTAGLDTVAVRMPDHPVALRLITAAGCPVAAPSANRSGRPSPTRADHVAEDLLGRIDGLVDGGATGVGLESTVVRVVDGQIVLLRPGGVTAEMLRRFGEVLQVEDDTTNHSPSVGEGVERAPRAAKTHAVEDEQVHASHDSQVQGQNAHHPASGDEGMGLARQVHMVDVGSGEGAPRSPGMKYTHYAPRGEMELVAGASDRVQAYIQAGVDAAGDRGLVTGVLTYTEHEAEYRADHVVAMGSLAELETVAHGLYAALREMDASGVERIWAQACPDAGIGEALLNRLAKAAGHRLVQV
nr:L-threonylcarbamoyladenylate synthase [Paenibacillus daejeonensis]